MTYGITGQTFSRGLRRVAIGLAVTVISLPALAQIKLKVGTDPNTGGGAIVHAEAGKVFIPQGFTTVGVLYPTMYDTAMCTQTSPTDNEPNSTGGQLLQAAQTAMTESGSTSFTTGMVTDWNANTVRFQVSQGALVYEYQNSLTAYTDMVQTAITNARKAGLVVIVSMQTEAYSCSPLVTTPSGSNNQLQKLPDVNTETAWAQLLDSTITNDTGIILEPFNEPNTNDQCGSYSWTYWASGCPTGNAGASTDQGMVTVGIYLRSLAPNNILLFDGDNNAGGFGEFGSESSSFSVPTNMPSNSAYTVHPFYYAIPETGAVESTSVSNWNSRFGYLESGTSPFSTPEAVVATAWNEANVCSVDTNNTVTDYFLTTYLPGLDIGLLAYAWDSPGGTGYLVNSYNTGSDPNYNYGYVDYTTTPSNTTCDPTDGATELNSIW